MHLITKNSRLFFWGNKKLSFYQKRFIYQTTISKINFSENCVRPSTLFNFLTFYFFRVKDKFHLCLPNKYFMTQFLKTRINDFLDRIVCTFLVFPFFLVFLRFAFTFSTEKETTHDNRCFCILKMQTNRRKRRA